MLLKNVHLGLLLHFIFVIIASAKSLRDHSDDSRFLHYDGEEEDHDSTVPTWKISSSPNKKDSDDDELRYFVEFNENSSEYQMRLSNAKRIHSTLKPEDDSHVAVNLFLPDDNVEVVTFQSKEEMVKWKQNPEVKRIERDSKIYKYQSKENIPYGVERVKALDIPDNFVNNRKVCVIDSGYDTTHQDLPSAETGGEVTGAEGVNAYAWDQDSDGHGTHVAGTIAALGGNKKGVVGVVRNGKLKLHIVRVFGASDEWVWASSLASAVQECVNAGANIVNMSLGGKGSSTVEEQLYERFLTQNNVLLIAAAGNDGNDAKSYPASYDSVMSVAALKNNNVVASFSQKNDKVDISAPGVGILSTLPGNRYGSWQGTSMATPHVSGVAALIWSHYPTKTAQEIWNTLTESALDLGEPGRDDSYGHGLIQADKAIELLGGIVETSSPSEIPTVEPSAVPSLSPSLPPTDLPTSTSVPTMIPSIHPSPSPSSCFDYPNWHDKFGLSFNCEFYEINNKCELYGDSFAGHHNKTANQACCACGGGTSSAQPTVTPTLSPTRRTPSISPTKSPSIRPVGVSKPSLQQGGCFDDPPGWHDALSSSYDCSYYEKNNECNAFGDMFRGVGNKTAKEACCFCGGGNIKVSNTPSSSPNGGFS